MRIFISRMSHKRSSKTEKCLIKQCPVFFVCSIVSQIFIHVSIWWLVFERNNNNGATRWIYVSNNCLKLSIYMIYCLSKILSMRSRNRHFNIHLLFDQASIIIYIYSYEKIRIMPLTYRQVGYELYAIPREL